MNREFFAIAIAFIILHLHGFTQTWTPLNSGTTESLYGIYTTANDVFAVGNTSGSNGIVLKSSNQGLTWTSQTLGVIGFRAVYFTSLTNGCAVAGDPPQDLSHIFKTVDGGSSWTEQMSLNPTGLYSVYFADLMTGYSVGGNTMTGFIYKSTDGGTSWTSQISGTANALYDVVFTNVNTGFAVGANGTILKTINGGVNWTLQPAVTTNLLTSVCFPNANTGYAVGFNGIFLRTINAGVTWTIIPISGISIHLWSVYFFNVNHGFAVGENGTIIETNDGGISWSQYFGVTAQTLRSVHFLNANLGYACGSNGVILKYTNDTIPIDSMPEVVCGDVYVPNAFSPNGDDRNDTLFVRGNCIKEMKFEIYDRWGEKVFETSDKAIGWDGKNNDKEMDPGIFVYYLKATLIDGKEVEKKGNISLIR